MRRRVLLTCFVVAAVLGLFGLYLLGGSEAPGEPPMPVAESEVGRSAPPVPAEPRTEEVRRGSLVPNDRGVVQGRVAGAGALESVLVVVEQMEEDDVLARTEAAIDGDRAFRFQGLVLGSYRVYLQRAGRPHGPPALVHLSDAEPTATIELRLDVDKYPVFIRDETGRAVGALGTRFRRDLVVVATEQHPGDTVRGIVSDADGDARYGAGWYEGVPTQSVVVGNKVLAGVLHAGIAPPFHASLVARDAVLQTVPVLADTRSLEFVLDVDGGNLCGKLRGRVLDPARRPIARAGVALLERADQRAYVLSPCGANGAFELLDVPPGEWMLLAETRGSHARRVLSVAVGKGSQIDVGEILLGEAALVSGRILDLESRPVAAEVWIGTTALGSVIAGLGEFPDERAREDGRFMVGGLPREELLIGIRGGGEWAWNPQVVDLRQGSVEDYSLLARDGVPLQIVFMNPRACVGRVAVADRAGIVVWTKRLASGDVDVLCLSAGAYTLTWSDPWGEERRQDLALGDRAQRVFLRPDGARVEELAPEPR